MPVVMLLCMEGGMGVRSLKEITKGVVVSMVKPLAVCYTPIQSPPLLELNSHRRVGMGDMVDMVGMVVLGHKRC